MAGPQGGQKGKAQGQRDIKCKLGNVGLRVDTTARVLRR